MWRRYVVEEVSVLIGGKAGDGVNSAGMVVAQLMNQLGYYTFMYYDYPSLIRGGHNFALVRGAGRPVTIHRDTADFVLALNQDTLLKHKERLSERTITLFNSDVVKDSGQGVSISDALQAVGAPPIMGNSALIGAFAKAAGIPLDTVREVFFRHLPKGVEQNFRVAQQGYDQVGTVRQIPPIGGQRRSLVTGNEAIGLGLVSGGLSAYVSYPMTPSSSLLHFLAENAGRFGLKVMHPENEIAVILMSLGFAYAGQRAAVGTSGGGFCLMTEGLSLAGMAEIPVVLVVSQRTGPSTGVPTYTGQSDLNFVLHAGHGEFPRFVVAPGDAEEAYRWSAAAMEIAWRYQVPAFILADKTLSEGLYSMDPAKAPEIRSGDVVLWDHASPYQRYADTASGVSPLAFPGTAGAVVKVNSYVHDADGITTEEAGLVSLLAKKRMRKGEQIAALMATYQTITTAGSSGSDTAVICWGSVKGVCAEVCGMMGLGMVQPVVLSPFPAEKFREICRGFRRLIAVEENVTGQLARLLRLHGITVHAAILHDTGRPLTPDVLMARLQEVTS